MFFPSRPTSSSEKSIAVLPFTDMSEKQDQEFFSDGLTEDIITQLAKIKAFSVTSRTSVMQYKHNTKSIKQIGEELGTVHILEGSVQRAGNQVRITAQLINAVTDEHLWAETYDRTLDSIFSIQTDIANKIARALEATLTPAEKQLIEKKYTTNTEAYQLYLEGRYFWNQRLEEPVKKSITLFKQAIALDSAYALAYAGLGDAYLMLGVYSALKPDASFPQAKLYAEKALQLDPALAEAYATLIDINIHYTWDIDAAEKFFQKAIALNPNYANAYHWHSKVYDIQHKFDLAAAESNKALQQDPYNLIINSQLGINLNYAGKFQEAIDQLQKGLAFDSTFVVTHYHLGIAYVGLKQFEKAKYHFQKSTLLAHHAHRFQAAFGFAEAMTGNKSGAQEIQKELLIKGQSEYVPAYDFAVLALGLGETEQAMQYLEQAYTNREPWMPFIGMNPLFTSLFGNSHFQELVRRIKGLSN
jgi:TolB-like protein/Flp pilus assembly protein TadD